MTERRDVGHGSGGLSRQERTGLALFERPKGSMSPGGPVCDVSKSLIDVPQSLALTQLVPVGLSLAICFVEFHEPAEALSTDILHFAFHDGYRQGASCVTHPACQTVYIAQQLILEHQGRGGDNVDPARFQQNGNQVGKAFPHANPRIG